MAKGLLNSGAKPARGGKRIGAGRPPDWLREKCQRAVDKKKLVEFLVRVATGIETEEHVTKDGDVIEISMSGMVRLKATEMLLDRGFGKAMQSVEHSGSVTLAQLLDGTWEKPA